MSKEDPKEQAGKKRLAMSLWKICLYQIVNMSADTVKSKTVNANVTTVRWTNVKTFYVDEATQGKSHLHRLIRCRCTSGDLKNGKH